VDALMRPTIFVTQPVAETALERLRTVADVDVNSDDSQILPKGKLVAAMRRHDILFSLLHDKVDRDVLAANPKFMAVASMAVTPDAIDVAEATRRGIPVTVIPPVVHEATADIAFGLILAVARRIVEGDRLVRAGGFPGSQSNHLAGACVYGKTLGLVGGKGRIGQGVTRRARGFGMRVLYSGPRPLPEADAAAIGFTHVPFEELLAQSDFVSLHPPYTPETKHLMNDRTLAMMRKNAFLINTARGAIVEEAALVRALKAKTIAGAGLDVHEHEPRVALALRKMPNVVLLPHLGSAVRELRERMAHIVVDNIFALIEGRVPPNCVNPQVLKERVKA
jgi:glyoxylate reductase